jgi:transposase
VVINQREKECDMRILGIDLAVTAKHQAIIADERGQFVSPVIKFETCPGDLDRLRARALDGAEAECPLVVVMEATNTVWYPLAAYFERHQDTVYLVNPRVSADLARFYKRYAKSDRLSAKVLARIPVVIPDRLNRLVLSSADHLALKRGCQELDRLTSLASQMKNRLQTLDYLVWPGLKARVFHDPFGRAACWFREHFYHPQKVIEAGVAGLRQTWRADPNYNSQEGWIEPLVRLAREVLLLYGDEGEYLDYEALAAEMKRGQRRLSGAEEQARYVRLQVTRPRYRRLHPHRHLETLYGVGQEGAAVYVSFVGDIRRFPSNRTFRGWSGLVPRSNQSGEAEGKGLHITQAGPDLIKKYAYLNADVARQYDPQFAALYYDQMVNKGKHHCQAVCTCATHLLDRVRCVLLEDRPYELRDVDGTPVSPEQARQIIAERYVVPKHIRQRNNRRARRERAEKRAERKEKRRSRSRS